MTPLSRHSSDEPRCTPDQLIATLARAQFGVVERRQLLAAGLSTGQIRHRVLSGRLIRLHRGVYAAGHARLDEHGRWLAAVLACGPRAVLSHRSAAALWGIRPTAARAAVEITVPAEHGARSCRGVIVHRSRALSGAVVASRLGIPVTSVESTFVDIAGICTRREVERALDEAQVRGLLAPASRHRMLARATGRRGGATLRDILAHHLLGSTLTRSELEERFLALCTHHELQRPQVNIRVAGIEADFLWPRHGLVAETDGRQYHGTPAAFERDRVRDQRLLVAGYRVVRFSYAQVVREPAAVAVTLRRLLDP